MLLYSFYTYPECIPPRRGPVPGVVVRNKASPIPGHADDHVCAVHGMDVHATWRGRLTWELLAGNAQVVWSPTDGYPAGRRCLNYKRKFLYSSVQFFDCKILLQMRNSQQ
jgi:hypothetical protein